MDRAPPVSTPRRRFLKRLTLLGAGLAMAGYGYARWIESRWLGIGRHEVPLGKGAAAQPIRLLHLSDFHASDVVPLSFIEQAIQAGLRLEPDLICLTGDFITSKFEERQRYAAVLAPLARRAPTFACLGNHDGGWWARSNSGYHDTSVVRGILAQAGVTLLHNTSRSLTIKGRPLSLVGVGDLWAGELDADAAFAGVSSGPSVPTLLLSHNPDSKTELARHPWDLLLCGHAHGGQFYLPVLGTPFAPVDDRRFVQGLHRWQERWLHVTKGVGNLHGLRFNCRPEISLLTLT
jgi:predicted MPP superfamily phosphohydrolase